MRPPRPAPSALEAIESGDVLDPDAFPPSTRPSASLAVLDISEYYGPDSGGVRTYLQQKARYVASHPALRQAIVIPGASSRVKAGEGVTAYQLASPRIPLQQTYRVLTDAGRFRAIVRHESPSVIEAGSAYGAPWLAAREARTLGVPAVWYYHAHLPSIAAHAAGPAGPLAWSAAGFYVRQIASRMARVLVASAAVADDLERLGVTNTTIVPLGVDTEQFAPARRTRRQETLARLQLPDAPIALYTGRFTREKALDVALRAWRRAEMGDAFLVLAGAGPLAGHLADAADRNVRVVPFEHDRDRLADLYAAADVYLAPGPSETFGLSAHEALASGTPVLTVDGGAVPATVRRAGAGTSYARNDAAGLAAGFRWCLEHRAPLGQAGRRHVEREHRWDVVFDRLIAVYRELARA